MRSHPPGPEGGPVYDIQFHPSAAKEYEGLAEPLRRRFDRAIDQLAADPFRPRPGVDVKKLVAVDRDDALYRLRVGQHRALYITISAQRLVWVLMFAERGLGYARLVRTAMARRRR